MKHIYHFFTSSESSDPVHEVVIDTDREIPRIGEHVYASTVLPEDFEKNELGERGFWEVIQITHHLGLDEVIVQVEHKGSRPSR